MSFLSFQQPLSSTNFLYELDRITKDILDVIMEGQKMSVPGDQLGVPGATEKVSFCLTRGPLGIVLLDFKIMETVNFDRKVPFGHIDTL